MVLVHCFDVALRQPRRQGHHVGIMCVRFVFCPQQHLTILATTTCALLFFLLGRQVNVKPPVNAHQGDDGVVGHCAIQQSLANLAHQHVAHPRRMTAQPRHAQRAALGLSQPEIPRCHINVANTKKRPSDKRGNQKPLESWQSSLANCLFYDDKCNQSTTRVI